MEAAAASDETLAAVFAQLNMHERVLTEIISEEDPTAFQFGEFGLEWRGRTATARQVTSARSSLGLAFGSCSFQEPVEVLLPYIR